MSAGALKGIGIGCFVVCAILLFVAWDRYHDNANKVEASRVDHIGAIRANQSSDGKEDRELAELVSAHRRHCTK
jgi:hypothetical protein